MTKMKHDCLLGQWIYSHAQLVRTSDIRKPRFPDDFHSKRNNYYINLPVYPEIQFPEPDGHFHTQNTEMHTKLSHLSGQYTSAGGNPLIREKSINQVTLSYV